MKRSKRSLVTTIIFYALYLLLLVGFAIGMHTVLGRLHSWLEHYEASQPKYACQQVFDEIFAAKDWEKIASLSQNAPASTDFESADRFVEYLKLHYDNAKISYTETSAGLSGDKKYIVKANDQKFASFTLTCATAESEDRLDSWQLGTVETVYRRDEDVKVTALNGHKITVNGVEVNPLYYTVRKSYTAVEHYLPEGLHGPSEYEIRLSGFLLPPEVKVFDEQGKECALAYDAADHRYTENEVTGSSYTEEEEKLAVAAVKSYALFMIGATGRNDLAGHFDASSEIYSTICRSDTWMQSYNGYEFSNPSLSQFYRYSEDLFSVRIAVSLFVTRKNGTVKEYELDSSFFFTKKDGRFLVTEMTNVDVMKKTEEVRLDFYNGKTLLQSGFITVGCRSFRTPNPEIPEGKRFVGWAEEKTDEKGNITMTLRFVPKNGSVSIGEDFHPTPMVLYPLFETEDVAQ